MYELDHECPICGTPLPASGRYPNYICEACVEKATDERGRPLGFVNVSPTGGFQAVYRDTGADAPGHTCYIGSTPCWADEARMGGIVVEPVDS